MAIKRKTNSDVISERKVKNDEDSFAEGNNQLKSGEVRIGLSKNVTRNMGNYESVKIGILPRSMFQVGNKKPHGLYSEHHIKTIVSVAKDCGIKQGTSFRESNFQEKVWDAIEDLNEIFIRRK